MSALTSLPLHDCIRGQRLEAGVRYLSLVGSYLQENGDQRVLDWLNTRPIPLVVGQSHLFDLGKLAFEGS